MLVYDHGKVSKFPIRLSDPPEKCTDPPEERAEFGRWLELADAALFPMPRRN
jgi:hypothetical protein